MDGVGIVLSLLEEDAGILALIDMDAIPSRLAGGVLTATVALPALSVTEISSVDRNIPDPAVKRHVRQRIQVTGIAATYPAVKGLLAAVKTACADKMPADGSLTEITVHTDGAGPDMYDEDLDAYVKTQDFLVRYNEVR